MKFACSFWSNLSNCTARLGANMIIHSSEMELYIILSTLAKFDYEMSPSQMKLAQCSLAMVGFFLRLNKYF